MGIGISEIVTKSLVSPITYWLEGDYKQPHFSKSVANWLSGKPPLFLSASTSCIRLSTSWQRSRSKNDDVSSVQSHWTALIPLPMRGLEEGGVRPTCSCLPWLRQTVLRCIPKLGIHVKIASPLRLPQVGGRQSPPLFYRHILWSQLPHQPHNRSHVSVMHIWPIPSAWPLALLGLVLRVLTSWYFLCREENSCRTVKQH